MVLQLTLEAGVVGVEWLIGSAGLQARGSRHEVRGFLFCCLGPHSSDLGPFSCFAPPSTRSFSSLPTLKNGKRLGGTSTEAPVMGLRPRRGSRVLTVKLPNPRISIRSSFFMAPTIESKTISTA